MEFGLYFKSNPIIDLLNSNISMLTVPVVFQNGGGVLLGGEKTLPRDGDVRLAQDVTTWYASTQIWTHATCMYFPKSFFAKTFTLFNLNSKVHENSTHSIVLTSCFHHTH